MTETECGKLIALLYLYYPHGPEESVKEKVKAYYRVWQDVDVKAANAAILAYAGDGANRFFPTPGQILDKVRMLTKPKELTEQEAWAMVRRALSRSDSYVNLNGPYAGKRGYEVEFERLPEEIKRVVHAPEQLRAWAQDPDFNEGVVSSNFMRSYRAKRESERQWEMLPEKVREYANQLGSGMQIKELDAK